MPRLLLLLLTAAAAASSSLLLTSSLPSFSAEAADAEAADARDDCSEIAEEACGLNEFGRSVSHGDLSALLQLSASLSSSSSSSPSAPSRASFAASNESSVAASATAAGGGQLRQRQRSGGYPLRARPWRQVEEEVRSRRDPSKSAEKPSVSDDVWLVATYFVMPVVLIMMIALLAGSWVSHCYYTSFIPETLCTVAIAVLLGGMIRSAVAAGLFTESAFTLLDATVLNLFLLPIIIFEGGWFCSLPNFTAQFPYIIVFSVFGTGLSIVIIGQMGWWLSGHLHPVMGWRLNYAFAALISATDPVATLSTFAQLRIAEKQPLLNTLVFGESMINDAVAIVVFNAVNSSQGEAVSVLITEMATLFLGSMLFGTLVAATLVLPMRFLQLPGHTAPEVFYIFLSPYLIYASAEALEFSGIIACLFAGIIFKVYGSQHLSEHGLRNTDAFLENMARFADTAVFILCGASTAFIEAEFLNFCFFGLFVCLFARAIMVSVCGSISNKMKRMKGAQEDDMISWKHKVMIWLSGLRGGIGLCLALQISTQWCDEIDKERIVSATFFLICTLLLICGTLTAPCLRLLGLVDDSEGAESAAGGHSEKDPTSSMSEVAKDKPFVGFLNWGFQSLLVGGSGRARPGVQKETRWHAWGGESSEEDTEVEVEEAEGAT